jgi:hypothetical protein
MKRVRASLVWWYVAVLSLAFGLVLAHPAPVAAEGCDHDGCNVGWCNCVGPCGIGYTDIDFRFSWDCPPSAFVCYEARCVQMDGFPDCMYICCGDFVRDCMEW